MHVILSRRATTIVATFVSLFIIIVITGSFHEPTYNAIKNKTIGPTHVGTYQNPAPSLLNSPGASGFDKDGNEKLAYVILLSGTVDSTQGEDLENDVYFVATRILVWQLLHVPETRTKHDVIVLVTPTVSQSRRDRLEKDGVQVRPVEFVEISGSPWIKGEARQFDDLMTKFRAWQLTEYNRVLLFDSDSMVRKNMDKIFDEPLAQIQKSLTGGFKPLEGQMKWPDKYLFAGGSEVWDSNHKFPPTHDGGGLKYKGNMNAGL